MIRINVIKEKNKLKKITFEGHADYEDYGKDILCAAVSATYLCTVNAILSFGNNRIFVEKSTSVLFSTLFENVPVCLFNIIFITYQLFHPFHYYHHLHLQMYLF